MKKFDEPWEHYVIDNFLPDNIYNQLKEIDIKSNNSFCDGSRTPITGRFFFTPDKNDSLTNDVVKFFQDNKNNFEINYGYSLEDSYIRIELAQDNDSFWQVPHLDTFEKRITIIVYISSDDVDLGTDLYNDKKESIKRIEWAPNRCFIFKTDKNKWHGFKKRKFKGNRRVLLVNFVDKNNWKSKEQVWDS